MCLKTKNPFVKRRLQVCNDVESNPGPQPVAVKVKFVHKYWYLILNWDNIFVLSTYRLQIKQSLVISYLWISHFMIL